jgi:16S rRNA (adenine(1408)-N(1))-methyltransferase
VVVDLGTGDGLFVYQCARANPDKLYVGIDANARQLDKISEKLHRNPRKGGAPNALFVRAAAEALPSELDGMADEVYVNLPWGSLLRGVAIADAGVLSGIRRISRSQALLKIIIAHDPVRDRLELDRLQIPPLSVNYLQDFVAPRYEQLGFKPLTISELAYEEWNKISTSWAKRLRSRSTRRVFELVFRVCD